MYMLLNAITILVPEIRCKACSGVVGSNCHLNPEKEKIWLNCPEKCVVFAQLYKEGESDDLIVFPMCMYHYSHFTQITVRRMVYIHLHQYSQFTWPDWCSKNAPTTVAFGSDQ